MRPAHSHGTSRPSRRPIRPTAGTGVDATEERRGGEALGLVEVEVADHLGCPPERFAAPGVPKLRIADHLDERVQDATAGPELDELSDAYHERIGEHAVVVDRPSEGDVEIFIAGTLDGAIGGAPAILFDLFGPGELSAAGTARIAALVPSGVQILAGPRERTGVHDARWVSGDDDRKTRRDE